LFEKKDYFTHYSGRKFKTFEYRDCVICGYEMYVPAAVKNITTCSEYCSSSKLRKIKLKGYYSLCEVCDKAIWNQPRKHHKYCSKTCANAATSIFAWERDIKRGYKKYYGPNWYSQRRRARERDLYQCQKCGISEELYGKQMSVHHIIPFALYSSYSEANQLTNLLSVCEPCHRKIHSGDFHHTKYL